MAEVITEKRQLRYDFSAKEQHELSIQQARKQKELVELEEEKKSVSSQYKARIDEIKATLNKLSNQVVDGFELREVDCEVRYHQPERGRKTIIRLDTGKVHAFEKMEAHEYNLFNQPEDEDTTNLLETERDKLRGGRKNKGELC